MDKKALEEENCRRSLLFFINHYKDKEQSPVVGEEISHLGMGQIIALYTYARYTGIQKYKQKADKLLDEIFLNVSMSVPVCLKNGLLGIGCALIYLIRNRFVVGEEDEVLSEIDSSLFCSLIFFYLLSLYNLFIRRNTYLIFTLIISIIYFQVIFFELCKLTHIILHYSI